MYWGRRFHRSRICYLARWSRIQDDRGQKVVSSSPYQIVRPPMYAAIIILIICIPLLIGSWCALTPAMLIAVVYVIRTSKEDQMLQEGLTGYREYAGKVRYQLIPGIW